ncbi:DNA invertase Pin-like site-specific DNA recombinase [Arthrobacter sp. CAN_A214]|uniref:recombinase family protein n=1 Tax=Arthrobacter sp. CAN_A214 TaxID=2787720 RepID=UPI0018CB39EB
MTGQRVGYIRVSTLDQNTVRQLDGVQVDKVYVDKASGKDQNRPELEAMIGFVRDGDTVLVHSMDRLARNLEDLRHIVRRLTGKKVRVEFVKEQLSFTGDDNAMATLLLNVMGVFAEFEWSLIRERQREGIALAKKRGVYRGRTPSLDAARAGELREKAAAGVPKAALARQFGISRETPCTRTSAKASCKRPGLMSS